MSGTATNRDARFDAVRVVAMLMIIFGHIVVHGIRKIVFGGDDQSIYIDNTTTSIVNLAMTQFLMYAGTIGPNLFMMISGYFLIIPRPFNYALKKTGTLWVDIAFYAIGIYCVYLLVGGASFDTSSFIKYCTPLHSRLWWFMTIYVAILLLSPFLAAASKLSHREYLCLLGVLLVLNFAQESIGYGRIYSGGMSLPFFCFLFLVGGYVRMFELPAVLLKHSGKAWLVMLLGLTMLSIIPSIQATGIHFHVKSIGNNSLPIFMAFFCFIWLINLPAFPPRLSAAITSVSPAIMGVYLIHEHPIMRNWLWNELLHPAAYVDRMWFIPAALAVTISIFLACIGIDLLCRPLRRAICKAVSYIYIYIYIKRLCK